MDLRVYLGQSCDGKYGFPGTTNKVNFLLQTSIPTTFVTYLSQIYGPTTLNVTNVMEWWTIT